MDNGLSVHKSRYRGVTIDFQKKNNVGLDGEECQQQLGREKK